MKYEKLEVGKTYYQHKMVPMGNTSRPTHAVWSVTILEHHPEKGTAIVRWNGNSPKKWFKLELEKLKVSDQPPVPRAKKV